MPITYDPPGHYAGNDATLADLTEEVRSHIQGFTLSSDQLTSLSADIASTDLTIPVTDASDLSRGIVEIEGELIWVQSVDKTTNTLTVLPKGRGWRGTLAAAHAAGETVVVAPVAPAAFIKREINNTLKALYPDLYGVTTTSFTYDDIIKMAWPLPADAENVIDVRFKDLIGNWQRVRGWESENGMDTTDFPSGRAVRISQAYLPPGQPVQVVYATRPQPLDADTDDFSLTNLPISAKDVVVFGAILRLLPAMDTARLSVSSVSAEELAGPRPLGSALAVAKDYRQQFQLALARERAALVNNYPVRIHFTR